MFEQSFVDFLKKRWIPVAAVLLVTAPPGVMLYLQETLAPMLVSATESRPAAVLKCLALLLWLCLGLAAFLYLQRPWFRWEESSGTWVSRLSALRYCAKCRATKIVTPLKNEVTGWRCMHCNNFFYDPARADIESPKKNIAKSKRI